MQPPPEIEPPDNSAQPLRHSLGIPAKPNAVPGWPETVRLHRRTGVHLIPESCSGSSRNTVRNHPGIAFILPWVPQLINRRTGPAFKPVTRRRIYTARMHPSSFDRFGPGPGWAALVVSKAPDALAFAPPSLPSAARARRQSATVLGEDRLTKRLRILGRVAIPFELGRGIHQQLETNRKLPFQEERAFVVPDPVRIGISRKESSPPKMMLESYRERQFKKIVLSRSCPAQSTSFSSPNTSGV